MIPEQRLHVAKGSAAAVEQFNGTGLEKCPVMPAELLIVDRAAALLIAVTADREILAAAHFLNAAKNGIAALVVHAGRDQIQKLFPFAVDIRRQQQTAPRDGGEQQVERQLQRVLQHAFAPGEKVILRKTGVKTAALNLTDPAYDGLDDGSVEFFHPGTQRLHVGER